MKIFNKTIQIKFLWIVVLVMLVVCVAFGILFFCKIGGDIVASLWGSLMAGFIVAILQLVLSYYEFEKMNIINQLGLIGLFKYRNDKKIYAQYIKTAEREIDIMGHTSYRFFLDFANMDRSASADDRLLLTKLQEGVVVRILLPDSTYLSATHRQHSLEVKEIYDKIRQNHTFSIEIRYFDHIPNHSIFKVDDSCIIGPIFDGQESKYTPGLQLKNTSDLAKTYLEYFDKEWAKAHE